MLVKCIFFLQDIEKKKSDNKDDLIEKLEQDSNIAVKWFRENKMIVNPDKFQAMLLQKSFEEN